MAKYKAYNVTYIRKRPDGRVEECGRETRIMTRAEAEEVSYTAIVEVGRGLNGNPIYVLEGRHCQFDPHLGWVS